MPGITGIISKAPVEEGDIDRMVACMVHEPFYSSGKYISRRLGLYMGWVCHRGSVSDCMPVWNGTKDVCLIFAGEDFMELSDIHRLMGKGHECQLENAGYLVDLYEGMGLSFLEKLNGWFSGVLVDLRNQSLVVFNDRYGLNRIYYHENDEGFYFSSEAKSLLYVLPRLRRLDLKGLAETFSCGCVLQNRTLFSDVSLLPGGSSWVFSQNGNIRKNIYFSPERWEKQSVLTYIEFYEALKETFARILPRYFRGRKRLAMSLTGGLDGRMIMAWANRPPRQLPCYTFGSTYRDCTDVRIARRVAKLCQQSHETIVAGAEFLAEFASLAEKAVFLSDGTMDVTGSVELYMNRIARQIAPVRVTGNYGSEILRGNIAFRPRVLHEDLLEPEFAALVRAATHTYRSECEGHRLSFIAFKQVPWHHYSRLSVEHSQLTLRSPYLDNDLVALMYQAPRELILSKEPSLRLISEGNNELGKIATDRGLLYRPTPLIGAIQQLYAELTAKSEYICDYGMPQWLAGIDHAMAPLHLERLFLGRHKFYHFRVWYRDQLSRYLKDVLLDSPSRTSNYLRRPFVEHMIRSHTTGNRNYTLELHWALTIGLVQRLLIEQR